MKRKIVQSLGVDDFVEEALSSAAREFGDEKCYVAADHFKKQLVLPIKPLALRWLIEANGWPIGRVTQSGGKFGTQKSSFIFQLIAWYLESGGVALLVDTENKLSDSLMRSIIPAKYFDAEQPEHKRFRIASAKTINEWQRVLWSEREKLEAMIEQRGRKPSFPLFWTVDSMMGADSDEALGLLKAEGEAPGRTFTDAPILISQYMRSFPDTLLGLPVTLHMSHHEKKNISTPGMRRAGGDAPDFYATLDLTFRRGGATSMGAADEYGRAEWSGKSITIDVRKSSMGSDIGKKLSVMFCWRFDDNNRQISWWDWSAATAMLLVKYEKQLADIMDIHHVQKQGSGEHMWSDALGVKEEDQLTAHDFGELVENNVELRRKLEPRLHIRTHPSLIDDAFVPPEESEGSKEVSNG